MSTESVRQFLLAVSTDSALQEKLAAVTDSVNFVQMVQECGYSFTLEDLQAHLAQHNNGELSEDELEAVAGGIQSLYITSPSLVDLRSDLRSLDLRSLGAYSNSGIHSAPAGNGPTPIPGTGPGPRGNGM